MNKKKGWISRISVLAAAMLILVLTVHWYSARIEAGLKTLADDTLEDVAVQNVLALEKEIHSKQTLLQGMAVELSPDSDSQRRQFVDRVKSLCSVYHFKRMGYIDTDGIAYTTDGYVKDLSFRIFFQKAMQGENFISDVILDTMGTCEEINVFSVPVYGDDQTTVTGVLFATYPTELFQKLLSVDSFDGQGYNFVMDTDGSVIAASVKSPMYGTDNFFDSVLEDDRNQTIVAEVRQKISEGKSGSGSYQYNGTRYFYYMPLFMLAEDDNPWYVFTIVPAKVLTNRVNYILSDVHALLLIMIAIIVAAVVFYICTYHAGRKELMHLAYKDPLTGGDNYSCFLKKMEEKKDTAGYLISADLNEFKIINNICGMKKGNETLRKVWEILNTDLGDNELAAHINADRFVLFLLETNDISLTDRLNRITAKIISLSESLQIPRCIPCFGIYSLKNSEDVEAAYSRATHAKKSAKGHRETHYAFYDDLDYQQIVENVALEDRFDYALQHREFQVWYQPKYSTHDCSIVGAEALVRWKKPDGSLISPGRFIPLFEKNGMISTLDEYMFQEVCRQQKLWMAQGKQILPVSVNISRASLYYSNICEKYKAILDSFELDPKYVQLEITESATIDNANIQQLIDQFHSAGFQLLLDDFGNGYSSLSTLNMMHFDTLKLDKSLIDYIGDANGEKLLFYIINLGKSLGLRVTAEGVERKEQVSFLQKLNCNDIQGFYFSKPLPLESYEALL